MMAKTKALMFKVECKCPVTRARVGIMRLKQTANDPDADDFLPCDIETPVFMPVGTNGTMKGLLPLQIEETGCRLLLSNTYHLAIRPGVETVKKAGGLHHFMKWPHAILTDSGGFQMVSLSKLMKVTEEEVTFSSPYDESPNPEVLHLSPEESIKIQQGLGSNIMMQLDDVISSTANDENRYREAVDRTIRWLDRCIDANRDREHKQNLFPIIQGGLNPSLRRSCVSQMVDRDTVGIAIGGLSGGEEKIKFVEMVSVSTEDLPEDKPRYLMGVGFAVDLLLCCALGCDMFDCVYPTRTARFGTALVGLGSLLHLKTSSFASDPNVLDDKCDCPVCVNGYSRAYLHFMFKSNNAVACHLLTQHNLRFQMRFMSLIRNNIRKGTFKNFIQETLLHHYKDPVDYPDFVRKALQILKILPDDQSLQ